MLKRIIDYAEVDEIVRGCFPYVFRTAPKRDT